MYPVNNLKLVNSLHLWLTGWPGVEGLHFWRKMNQQIKDTLKSINRSAIILIALGILKKPTGPVQLADITGLTRKTIKKHLIELSKLGMVHNIGRQDGYILTTGSQLFLTQVGNFLPELAQDGYKLPELVPTTTKLINSNKDTSIKEVEAGSEDGYKFPELTESDPEYPKWLAFKGTGVGEPSRSTLARMDITLEYIEAHIKQWRLDKQHARMLVHRIKNLDEMPVDKDDRQRYTEGKYKDHINVED